MDTLERTPSLVDHPPGHRSGDPLWLPGALERVDREMRLRGYSPRTRELYRGHMGRF